MTKTAENMNIKELRNLAKELNIPGRWEMTKTQLIEAINAETAKKQKATKKEKANETKKEAKKAMKVQRAFTPVAGSKSNERIISIVVLNTTEEQAKSYIAKLCGKMSEMDNEFHTTYVPSKSEIWNKEVEAYTTNIEFDKVKGKVAAQRNYVGKLMTKAMAALKNENK